MRSCSTLGVMGMTSERNPSIADHVEHTMHHQGCLAELHDACGRLDRKGFW